jgi:hypothetical protein
MFLRSSPADHRHCAPVRLSDLGLCVQSGRTSAPIIPHLVQTAFGHRVSHCRFVGPTTGVDRGAVVVKAGGAIDQQAPAAVGAHVAERNRLAAEGLGAPLRRRVVVGIAVARQTPLSGGGAVPHRRRRRPLRDLAQELLRALQPAKPPHRREA